MRLNPNQVAGQLARGLAPAYAIAGEEPLLITETLDAVRAAAKVAGYSERETFDVDKTFNWGLLAESCATGSLFASRRVVEVRLESSLGEEGASVLTQFATRPPADVLLIVTAGKLDSRARSSKWWTAFEQHAAAMYAWPLRAEDLPAFLNSRLRSAGYQPTPQALALLVQRTEGNLLAASQEITKLTMLLPRGPVDEDAVASVVADSAHVEVFGWIDRMLAGDASAVARGLERLREEGEDGLPIIGALAYDLRKLFAITQTVAQGRPPAGAVEAAGVFRNRQPAFTRAASRTRPGQVLRWLRMLNTVDMRFKSTPQSAAWEELLTLALAVSGTAISAPMATSGAPNR